MSLQLFVTCGHPVLSVASFLLPPPPAAPISLRLFLFPFSSDPISLLVFGPEPTADWVRKSPAGKVTHQPTCLVSLICSGAGSSVRTEPTSWESGHDLKQTRLLLLSRGPRPPQLHSHWLVHRHHGAGIRVLPVKCKP